IGFSDAKSLLETFPTDICCGLFPEIYPVKYIRKPRVPFEETCRHMGILLNRFERIETVEDHVSGLISKLAVDVSSLPRKAHKHAEHKIVAFLCAYGMSSIYHGRAEDTMFGNTEDGFIVVPVKND